MADTYIEQAMLAHSTAFADTTGALTLQCPQLVEAFNSVYAQVKRLQEIQTGLQTAHQIRELEGNRREEELADLKNRLHGLETNVSELQSDKSGFATMTRVETYCTRYVDRETVRALSDSVAEHYDMLQTTAERQDLLRLEKTVYDQGSKLDRLTTKQMEDNHNVSTHLDKFKSEAMQRMEAMCEDHQKLKENTDWSLEQLKNELAKLSDRTDSDLAIMRHEFDDKHKRTTDEILHHMKVQATALDTLQRQKVDEIAKAPTREELYSLRTDMDRMKKDMDEAMFKVHESYSQCLSLAKLGAMMGGNDNKSLARIGGSSVTPGAPLLGETMQSIVDQSGAMMDTPDSNDPNRVLSMLSRTSGVNNLGSSGVTASVELQVELLKKDVHKMLNVALPSCVGQVLTLKDDLKEVVNMHKRGEALVAALCQCVGLENEGDEMVSALRVGDANRVVLMLRSALNTVLGTQAIDRLRMAAKRMELERSPARQPQEFRLGIDVADSFTKAGKSHGAQVMSVFPASIAAQHGILAHDVIVELNGNRVNTCGDFVRELKISTTSKRIRKASSLHGDAAGGSLRLLVLRGGSGDSATITIPLESIE